MLREAIDKILNLAQPERWEVDDGRVYTSRPMTEVLKPLLPPIHVQTLTGLAELYELQCDEGTLEGPDEGGLIIHVTGHDRVSVITRGADEWSRRTEYVRAKVPDGVQHFRFGQYLEPDDFIVGLQTLFEAGPKLGDHYRLLKLVSNLSAEAVTIASDDGYSQTVATRQGVVMKAEEKIAPRVKLSPYRTFREIEQPTSEFVLRLKSRQNQTPMVALFEADGGEWMNTAVLSIKKWLGDKLKAADIVA